MAPRPRALQSRGLHPSTRQNRTLQGHKTKKYRRHRLLRPHTKNGKRGARQEETAESKEEQKTMEKMPAMQTTKSCKSMLQCWMYKAQVCNLASSRTRPQLEANHRRFEGPYQDDIVPLLDRAGPESLCYNIPRRSAGSPKQKVAQLLSWCST